jgi:uncharacterized protein YjbJ (UPF0337 family)
MNDQQLEGKADQVAGTVKEGVGHVTGNTQTEAEGQNQQAEGKAHQAAGDLMHKAQNIADRLGNAKDHLGDAISGHHHDKSSN